jgi:preprotein translocase subunit SecE
MFDRYIFRDLSIGNDKRIYTMSQISSYIKNSRAELSKVIFPTKPQVKQAFIAVFVVVAAVSLFLALVDFIMSSSLAAIL